MISTAKSKKKITKKATIKQRRQRQKMYKAGLIIILLASIPVSIICIINQPQFRIQSVSLEGAYELDSRLVVNDVTIMINQPRVLFIPGDLWFAYRKNYLIDTLMRRHPEIESVDMSVNDFSVLNITVTERVQQYYAVSNGITYAVDYLGILFRVDDNPQSVGRYFYSREEPTEFGIRDMIVDPEFFMQCNSFLDNLETQGIVVNRILFEDELQMIMQLEHGTRIIVSRDSDFQSIVATLREILRYKEFGFDFKTGIFEQPVSYINLRYGNKIFYCYVGDECTDNYVIN